MLGMPVECQAVTTSPIEIATHATEPRPKSNRVREAAGRQSGEHAVAPHDKALRQELDAALQAATRRGTAGVAEADA